MEKKYEKFKICTFLFRVYASFLLKCFDKEKDKLEFVKSIMIENQKCDLIIRNSNFFKKGITLYRSENCNSIKTIVEKYGLNKLDYEMDFINAGNTLTVSAVHDNPEIKIIFEFYYTGEHKDLLYRINFEYDPTIDE